MAKTFEVREVYITDLNGQESIESWPLGLGKTAEGRKPDKYGVYEKDIYYNWLQDFDTLEQAEKFKDEQVNKISQSK